MMRIGVIGCYHETNTFAPGLTPLIAFQSEWVVGRNEFYAAYRGTQTSMGGVIDVSERLQFELIPMFYTQTMPSSTVTDEAKDAILNEMLIHIQREREGLDGLIVILHGAMASETCQDVDGQLMCSIRANFEDKPIAATVDLHANLCDSILGYCNIIVGYDTYPHIDVYDRAMEACELLMRAVNREIQPTSFLARANLLIAPTLMNTNIEPMHSLMQNVFSLERDSEVLNITVAGGFAFADVFCAGATIVVTTNGNKSKAEAMAKQLAGWVFEHREEFIPRLTKLADLHVLMEKNGERPMVLVESSDNVGGGSPGDATHILCHLVENQIHNFLCVISDSEASEFAFANGVGSKFAFPIGGKTDHNCGKAALHGLPVEVSGRVRLLSDGNYIHRGPYMTGMKAYMGRTAVIELDHTESVVIITEKRVAPWDVNHVRSVGIEPERFDVIVVKASVAWKTAFGDLAKAAIEMDTPGACSSNLAYFTYKNVPEGVGILGG